MSRSSTGAVLCRAVSMANRTSAAASGMALSRCQGLASVCSPAAQATYAAIIAAATIHWATSSAHGRYQRSAGRWRMAAGPRPASSV